MRCEMGMDYEDKIRELEEAEKEWEEKILKPSLEANPERRAKFLTDIGLEIKRIYTPLDVQPKVNRVRSFVLIFQRRERASFP